MPLTHVYFRLPKTYDDGESLLPLLASLVSLGDLTKVAGTTPYVMVNPNMIDGVPL